MERNKSFSGKVICKGNLRDTVFPNIFDSKVSDDSIVLSDGHRAYNLYFKDKNIEHVVLSTANSDKKAIVKGAYHINNVNALHHRFRSFLRKYNGVATKYLQNYLSFFLWLENHRGINTEDCLRDTLLTNTGLFTVKDMAYWPHEPSKAPELAA